MDDPVDMVALLQQMQEIKIAMEAVKKEKMEMQLAMEAEKKAKMEMLLRLEQRLIAVAKEDQQRQERERIRRSNLMIRGE